MAMTFGRNSYINIGQAWTNLTTTTICFWVRINTLTSPSNRFIGSADTWEIRATTDWDGGAWRFSSELYSSTVTQPSPARSTTAPVINTWYHIAATVTPAKFGQIYVNGVLEGSGTSADNPTGTTLSLGNRSGAPANQCANGVMEDIRVYTRVLTATEIETIYACRGSDNIVFGLQNRWLLNEGAEGATAAGAGIIKDMAGGTTGTPVNSPVWAGSILKKRMVHA